MPLCGIGTVYWLFVVCVCSVCVCLCVWMLIEDFRKQSSARPNDASGLDLERALMIRLSVDQSSGQMCQLFAALTLTLSLSISLCLSLSHSLPLFLYLSVVLFLSDTQTMLAYGRRRGGVERWVGGCAFFFCWLSLANFSQSVSLFLYGCPCTRCVCLFCNQFSRYRWSVRLRLCIDFAIVIGKYQINKNNQLLSPSSCLFAYYETVHEI